ncbi:hypothetical protein LTV02_09290 [Nocardia yamanashiensis]|uniref:hypothetical protein n=1 Tax=Nocardia yamanashiensis TaxID=209247 RepID=UPI001E4578B6|nr:hypothetical protein [Nocardia yamanashiensis]UGT43553.1 hypothetical protein LTV02_09290 [Nocardia yamanashiensis]
MSTRIARLRALIDHPGTGAAERAAAQRMLDRMLGSADSGRSSGDRVYGARHDRVGRHADLDAVAEMIRADIALARTFTDDDSGEAVEEYSALRAAPPEVVFTVDVPFDGTITVTMSELPPGWEPESIRAVATELAEIMNAYNHNGEDTGPRFFARVLVGISTVRW